MCWYKNISLCKCAYYRYRCKNKQNSVKIINGVGLFRQNLFLIVYFQLLLSQFFSCIGYRNTVVYLKPRLICKECQIRKNAAGCKLNHTFLRMTTFLDKQMLFDFRKVVIQLKKKRSIL